MTGDPFDPRLFPLLAHALRLPADEVEPFLERECRGDVALATRVEELLRERRARAHLTGARRSPLLERLQRALRVPELLGSAADYHRVRELLAGLQRRPGEPERYEVREELGHGGMGVVHRVWDRTLHCELAMKRLLPLAASAPQDSAAEADEACVVRFLREAHITAQLDHPGIVSVHELGYTPDGDLYFTMDLVLGQRFDELLQTPGDLRRKVEVLHRATQAAAFAHERGVVHRDVSPRNIVVGEHGAVFLIDWGLARSAGALLGPDTEGRTQDAVDLTAGAFLGTLCYAAPEQAAGTPRAVDARADVYSFGAILHHVLSGHAPYLAGDETDVDARELRGRIRAGPPAALPRSRAVPGELAAIAGKAMARDPDLRYDDGAALADDLAAWLEGRPVAAYRAGALYRLSKWSQRHPALVLVVAVGLVLLLGAAVGTIALVTHKNGRIRSESQVAEASITFLEGLFASANPLQPDGGDVSVRDFLQEGRLRLAEQALHPAARARLAKSLGLTYLMLGDVAQAAELIEEAHAFAKANLSAGDPALLDVVEDLALLRGAQREFDESDRLFRWIEEELARAHGPSDPRTILTRTRRANGLLQAGRLEEGLALLTEAAELAHEHLGPTDPSTLLCRRDLAGALFQAGRLRESREEYERVLPQLEREFGVEHTEAALARHYLVLVLGGLHDYPEAERLSHVQRESLVRAYGPDSSQVASSDNNLATLYQQQRKFDLARPIQERLLMFTRLRHGDGDGRTLVALNNLARTLTETGDFEAARVLFEEAHRGRVRLDGDVSRETAQVLMNWGINESKAKNHAEAETYLHAALERYEAALGKDHPATIHCQNTLASHLREAGQLAEAEELFLDCVSRRRRLVGEGSPETWWAVKGLIRLYQRSGDLESAARWAGNLGEWTSEHAEEHAAALKTLKEIEDAAR